MGNEQHGIGVFYHQVWSETLKTERRNNSVSLKDTEKNISLQMLMDGFQPLYINEQNNRLKDRVWDTTWWHHVTAHWGLGSWFLNISLCSSTKAHAPGRFTNSDGNGRWWPMRGWGIVGKGRTLAGRARCQRRRAPRWAGGTEPAWRRCGPSGSPPSHTWGPNNQELDTDRSQEHKG